MRTFLQFLVLSIFAISCDTVVFDNPQPADVTPINKIEKKYSGIYIDCENDTLIITTSTISFHSNGKENKAILGSNAILKPYKKQYVLSVLDSSQYGNLWVCFPMQLINDSLYLYFADYGDLEKVEKEFGPFAANKSYFSSEGKRVKIIFSPKNSSDFEGLVNAGLFNKKASFVLVKQ